MKPNELSRKLNAVQKYALLLAVANDEKPIKGRLWFQKEMFLVEKNISDLASELGFEPALKGPMSEALEWNIDQLLSIGLLEQEGSALRLTDFGRECLRFIRKDDGPEELSMISEMKEILNDLSKDELLAIVYFLYPEMTIESEELENLLPRRKDIAIRLFKKGKVGLEKGSIIAGIDSQEFSYLLREKGISLYSE